MDSKLYVPEAVPLPRPAIPAKLLAPPADGHSFTQLTTGQVVHITSRAPDDTKLYVVAALQSTGAETSWEEGWLEGSTLQPLTPQEQVEQKARLPLAELLKRSTIFRAKGDWEPWEGEVEDPDVCVPSLIAGELVQLEAVRGARAYGWAMKQPNRRGWIPLNCIERVESTASQLASTYKEEGEELDDIAAASVLELVQNAPRPPLDSASACPPSLPPVVAASMREEAIAWAEKCERLEAQVAQEAEAQRAAEACNAQRPDTEVNELFLSQPRMPDDSFPLFVCRSAFAPPQKQGAAKSGGGALLTIEVGDLLRVTSLLEAPMYCGFNEDKPDVRGWFPKRCVEMLEDPLDGEADLVPVAAEAGPPPLPEIPLALRSSA